MSPEAGPSLFQELAFKQKQRDAELYTKKARTGSHSSQGHKRPWVSVIYYMYVYVYRIMYVCIYVCIYTHIFSWYPVSGIYLSTYLPIFSICMFGIWHLVHGILNIEIERALVSAIPLALGLGSRP